MIAFLLNLLFCLSTLTGLNAQIDPSSVSLTLRQQWCQGQQNTCGTLCSGDVGNNTCDPTTLSYACTCGANNSTPDLGAYMETIPYFICEQVYSNCIVATIGDAAAQSSCNAVESADCGHLNPNNFVAAATTASTAATAQSSVNSKTTTTAQPSLISKTTTTSIITNAAKSSSGTSLAETINSGTTFSIHTQEIIYTTTLADGAISTVTSFTAVGSSQTLSSSATSTSTFTSSNLTSSTSSSSLSSSGLSTGAKAGIGIGAAVVVIGLALGGYCLGRRHSGSGSTENRGPGVPELSTHTHLEVPELAAGEKVPWWKRRREKGSELDGGADIHARELGGREISEMQG